MTAAIFVHCRSCRSKLKRAAQLRMAAFCGPICWGKYYKAHCRVCDADIPSDKRLTGSRAVNTCSRECRRAYNQNRAIYAGFLRSEDRGATTLANPINQDAKSAHSTGFFEPLISGVRFTVWNSAGKHSCSPVRHPRHPRMWMIGETVFTEAELKAYLRPKPKKKGSSIPLTLVGSGYRAPLCPECFSHRPAVNADLLNEAECGWLRDEDAAFTSAAPVPVGMHEGTLPDLPACLDRRGSKTGTVTLELFKEAA